MKVLVTGGHGFIGSHVVRQLLAKGHEIRCLVRSSSKTHRVDGLPIDRTTGDVRDRASLEAAMKGVEACIHLASVSSWNEIRSPALEATIVDGTRNILDAAREARVARVVHVSSAVAVNGSSDPVVYNEESPFELRDPALRYAHAKHQAEGLVRAAVQGGLDVVTVNPCEVYGPQDDGFITAGNIRDILTSWPALACRGGTAVVHVEDVARGMLLAMERGRSGERYILGGDNLSVEELVRLTLDVAERKVPVLKLPNALVKGVVQTMAKVGLPTPVIPEILDYATLFWFMDSTKARQQLGYHPRPAREVIAPVVSWLREVGAVGAGPGTGSAERGTPGRAHLPQEGGHLAQSPAPDRPAPDRPAPDRPAPDRPATDRPGTDRPGTDRPGTDRPGTDRPGTDRPGTGGSRSRGASSAT